MSKSNYGRSKLYMTTKEFADLVVKSLEEQNYFKREDVAHPQDIAYAFSTVGETIGTTMSWAIKQEHEAKNELKETMMKTGNLSKNTSGSWASASYSNHTNEDVSPALLEQGEPLITTKDALEYSEWKNRGYL